MFNPETHFWYALSLPSRERGLKFSVPFSCRIGYTSLPSRERGLKSARKNLSQPRSESLPSRERGLKSPAIVEEGFTVPVAPFAGAWIEISTNVEILYSSLSLPSRERGLKYTLHLVQSHPRELSLPSRERGLKYFVREFFDCTFLSLPSRERGLKYIPSQGVLPVHRRSLRGSVD